MSITNINKPGLESETWYSIPSTWASETRTWQTSTISNASRVVSSMTNTYVDFGFLWSANALPWQSAAPWLGTTGISNQSKPS